MASLRGKVGLVTGASSGIGAETAKHLAAVGCQLVITGRNPDTLEATKRDCVRQGTEGDTILTIAGNLNDETFLANIVQKSIEHFGSLDVVVNCAGQPYLGTLERATLDKLDETLRINLRAPFILTHLAMPYLIKSKGAIVNVSSCASLNAHPSSLVYGMSKAGLDGLTRSAAAEYANYGVRVNAVNPGATMTPLFERNGADMDTVIQLSKRRHPLGRHAEVSEVAKAILFLASDAAAMVTGYCLTVDGGRSSLPGCPLVPIDDGAVVKLPI